MKISVNPNINKIVSQLAKCLIVVAVFSYRCSSIAVAREAANITATLDVEHAGAMIGTNFNGLSFEASLLLPDNNGIRYFRPDNRTLVNLFHTLGIKSLRIGGNTSDRDATHLPGPEDLDSLFNFAKVAQVKVIYCLQLCHGDPRMAARTAKYIMDHYAPWVDCFSIGQEPSVYPATAIDPDPVSERTGPVKKKCSYSTYALAWKQFADTIVATVPDVKLCGPSVHNDPRWTCEFIRDFGRSNHVSLITEHLYPGGAGGKVPSPEIGRNEMLGDEFLKTYQSLYNGFVPMSVSNGLPYRLEEVNSFFNGGATNVSNTFASALWGLDFMYWWAEHGAAGLNFHTGDRVAAGNSLQASKYTAFFSTTNGYIVRPLGYGIKAFDIGGHGRIIPNTISNSKNLNLSLYAVLGGDRNLYITVINKENGSNARSANLTIKLNSRRFAVKEMMSLTSPDNDIAASRGQTLGGSKINDDGSWNGKWTPLNSTEYNALTDGVFNINIPPASAYIIKLTPTKF